VTTPPADRLYALLPAIHRLRDAEQGYPLRALLAVIAREIGIVEEDIARLYANWFIETADEWIVPYLGDLLGVRGLHALGDAGFTRRAFVANTLSYRRRKGTPTMLEQLARDTTQWNARVVEFFELLGATQYLNHLRPHRVRTPDLRRTDALELLESPFDTIGHTADVRRIASRRGKHNIPNVGIFLWRLQAYAVVRGAPRPIVSPADGRYTFNPLGIDAPLFNRPQTETTITHLAGEVNVPGKLRRRALYEDLEQLRRVITTGKGMLSSRYFGLRQPVLQVYLDQPCMAADPSTDCLPLRPEEILICDLSDWATAGWEPPASQTFVRQIVQPGDPPSFQTQVAVDPVLGRLAVLKGVTSPPAKIEVSYAYGFSGDLGGGPYDRRTVSRPDDPALSAYEDTVAAPGGLGALYRVSAAGLNTLEDAILQWASDGKPDAVIQIDDSRTYEKSLTIPMAATDLVIQAANRQRPVVIGNLDVSGNQLGRLALNGLLIAGSVALADDSVRQLDVVHCTVVPGVTLAANGEPAQPETPSLVAGAANTSVQVNVIRSITGPLRLPENIVGLHARDGIIESPRRGHPADLLPALVSAPLTVFPAVLPAAPKVQVTIGGDGPHLAALAASPTDLAQARVRLQAAIRGAHPTAAFTQAQVIVVDDRLIVLPGAPAEVTIEPAEGDPTAGLLQLIPSAAEQRLALISAGLEPFPPLTAAAPELSVSFGDETHTVALAPKPATTVQARNRFAAALKGASVTPAFAGALAGVLANPDRLVIIPGAPAVVPAFDATAGDATTLSELRLAQPLYLPAIGGDRSGAQPGPAATLERVTVLGPVHVKELTLGSESIFTDRVRAVRRQAGCVRFSTVPAGSQTPRRFRCQPELAIASALSQAAEEAGGPLDPLSEETIRRWIVGRLAPAFTATRYGDPAYGQLSLACPVEICTGAEDGSEMGAFSFLKQPQRAANLQSNLEEYLRFGLEAGIFYVT
jgi:hypothetical protein